MTIAEQLHEEGRAKGREEGREQGRVAALRALLIFKFGSQACSIRSAACSRPACTAGTSTSSKP